MAVNHISKPPLPVITEGKNVSQSRRERCETEESRKGSVSTTSNSLFVFVSCYIIAVNHRILWHDGVFRPSKHVWLLRSWRIVGILGIGYGLAGQKIKAYVCLHLRGKAAAAEGQGMTVVGNYLNRTLHLNLYMAQWMHNEETEPFLRRKCALYKVYVQYSTTKLVSKLLWL